MTIDTNESFESPTKKQKREEPTEEEIPKRILTDDDSRATTEKFFIFALDGSSSLGPQDFKRQVSVATSLMSKFEDPKNQFALIQFGSKAEQIGIRTHQVSDAIKSAESMKQVGGNTDMTSALALANTIFETEAIRNPLKILILLTDGMPNDQGTTIKQADLLKINKNVEIFCFGFGRDINLELIQTIASPKLGHRVDNWDEVKPKVESLMGGLDGTERKAIKVTMQIIDRPYSFGKEVKFEFVIHNQSDKPIPAKSELVVDGNRYFEYTTDEITSEIGRNQRKTYELTVYPNDNVTIDHVEKSIKIQIIDPSGKVMYEKSKAFWVADFCKDLIDFTPIDLPRLNIGLFGTMGSGKSSFFNSICTLLQGSIKTKLLFEAFAPIASTGEHVTTKITRYSIPKLMEEDKLLRKIKFDIWDTYGLTPETYNNEEFNKFIRGELPENFDYLKKSNEEVSKHEAKEKRMHAVIFIIDQGERGDKEIMNKLKVMYKTALENNITPLVVATKIDAIRGLEKIDDVRKQFSELVGASKMFIFTAENYHSDMEQNFDIDLNTYKILEKALHQGNLFLKTLRNSRK